MELTSIIVTHILPTNTSFGATMAKPAEAVFIPAAVSRAASLVVGEEVYAQLVPNTMQPERTPWLAAHVRTKKPFLEKPSVPSSELVSTRVHQVMANGGVWTTATMFEELFPRAVRAASIKEHNATGAALRAMFARGDCAKFQLWRSPNQSKPSREWFTCHPEKADVDEWVEDAE